VEGRTVQGGHFLGDAIDLGNGWWKLKSVGGELGIERRVSQAKSARRGYADTISFGCTPPRRKRVVTEVPDHMEG